jgi:hypothetical protein
MLVVQWFYVPVGTLDRIRVRATSLIPWALGKPTFRGYYQITSAEGQ